MDKCCKEWERNIVNAVFYKFNTKLIAVAVCLNCSQKYYRVSKTAVFPMSDSSGRAVFSSVVERLVIHPEEFYAAQKES